MTDGNGSGTALVGRVRTALLLVIGLALLVDGVALLLGLTIYRPPGIAYLAAGITLLVWAGVQFWRRGASHP